MHSYDCVIVGGGIVGATLAVVLGQLHYSVLLIEKNVIKEPLPVKDARTLALSHASVKIYTQLGLWERLQRDAVPIEQVLVTVQNQWGSCWLKAKDVGLFALGYVIDNQTVEGALYQTLNTLNKVTVLHQAQLLNQQAIGSGWVLTLSHQERPISVKTSLLIAADGVGSTLAQSQGISFHQQSYGHYAIMANVKLNAIYPHTAVERFLKNGAIAFLPWKDGYATCAWTLAHQPDQFMSLSDQDFLACCQEQLGNRAGKLMAVGKRYRFPLNMQVANVQATRRFLLIGNAAHSLHPIAAQGFNLSLRDIWQLRSQLLNQHAGEVDLGSDQWLNNYLNARKLDQSRVIFATDKLARFMTGDLLPSIIRAMGITLFDGITPLKRKFTQLSMGI